MRLRQNPLAIIYTLCYNDPTMQGSYIGNTTASQAVKAGSTPVPCSKRKAAFWRFFLLAKVEGVEPIAVQPAGGRLLAPVRTLVTTTISAKRKCISTPVPCSKKSRPFESHHAHAKTHIKEKSRPIRDGFSPF